MPLHRLARSAIRFAQPSGWMAIAVGLACLMPAWAGPLDQILMACAGDVPPTITGRYTKGANGDMPPADRLTDLGRQIFFDRGLSASGRQSCASCHDPAHAYGPSNGLAVQAGGPGMNRFGVRTAPSLRYLHAPPNFTEHYIDLLDNNGQDSGPAGGRTWDGRVDLGHEQALMPLMDHNEMANLSQADLVARVRKAPYAKEFDALLSEPGRHILDDEEGVISWLTTAIEFFEQSPEDFHPFTSKYDAYLRGQAKLTAQEKRGFALFNDTEKGNCATCHPSVATSSTFVFPRFTDFEFKSLGVPRNRSLPANRDPNFYDLGLCGPFRKDLADQPQYCGMFRAPTLRNAALRHSFFHNGALHTLREVVDFYVTRDITPARWYPKDARGRVIKYDDLPVKYRANINTDVPFKPLPGNKPRLNEREVNDLLAFLNTLSDGYHPPPPAKQTMVDLATRHTPSTR